MAGLSKRFLIRGYGLQKFQLPLWEGTVFDYAVSSFSAVFTYCPFLFIYRETGGIREFLESRVKYLGIQDPLFVSLEQTTAGQAETVELGLAQVNVSENEELTIFNIDTFRMPWAQAKGRDLDVYGWLDVFRGSGDNWSFVCPSRDERLVARTSEKVPISDLCCTGLYHFTSVSGFSTALAAERESPSSEELYIAPIYNHLIARGLRIGFGVISSDDVVFCGVPAEYEALLKTPPPYSLRSLC
jgi:hypothetical protein